MALPPSPKRRQLRSTSSEANTTSTSTFTRHTSSELAGLRYGIKNELTWEVYGVGARVRSKVTSGYQNSPDFSPSPFAPRPFIPTISGNPIQDADFGNAPFLSPLINNELTSELVASGSGSGSSDESLGGGGGGAGYFGGGRNAATGGGGWNRNQSVPAHLFPHPNHPQSHPHPHLQPQLTNPPQQIFQSSHQTLLLAKHTLLHDSHALDARMAEIERVRGLEGSKRGGGREVRPMGEGMEVDRVVGGEELGEGDRDRDVGVAASLSRPDLSRRGTKRASPPSQLKPHKEELGDDDIEIDDNFELTDTESSSDEDEQMDTSTNPNSNYHRAGMSQFDRIASSAQVQVPLPIGSSGQANMQTQTQLELKGYKRGPLRPTKSLPARGVYGNVTGFAFEPVSQPVSQAVNSSGSNGFENAAGGSSSGGGGGFGFGSGFGSQHPRLKADDFAGLSFDNGIPNSNSNGNGGGFGEAGDEDEEMQDGFDVDEAFGSGSGFGAGSGFAAGGMEEDDVFGGGFGCGVGMGGKVQQGGNELKEWVGREDF